MKRNVKLEEISDGKLYDINDMVKADCHGCEGCSKCCHGMGSSIILDPYDVYRLTEGTGKSMQELLMKEAELNVVDGVVLPNLKMVGEEEACSFLNEAGRCSIHGSRPGICRLFPLGRYYENDDFKYFLQIGECSGSGESGQISRTKIKVSKWIDTPNEKANHEFILKWHNLLKLMEKTLQKSENDSFKKELTMLFLQLFYMRPYESGNFYEQIEERFEKMKNYL